MLITLELPLAWQHNRQLDTARGTSQTISDLLAARAKCKSINMMDSGSVAESAPARAKFKSN